MICTTMDKLKPPTALDFDSAHLASSWKKWKEEWELYEELALEGKDDKYKKKCSCMLLERRVEKYLKH